MKKLLFLLAATLFAGAAPAQEGVTIRGVTWATRNVGEPGAFVAEPQDRGGFYTFEQARTACPEGWRTPTSEEFESLVASGSGWTTVAGVSGRRFGRGGEQIFLPAFGHENYADRTLGYRDHGYYWSSTRPRNPRNFGHGLYFTRSDSYPAHANNRLSGYAVRCVR
jgi:uncharacterized protein (TIGR02145 family)